MNLNPNPTETEKPIVLPWMITLAKALCAETSDPLDHDSHFAQKKTLDLIMQYVPADNRDNVIMLLRTMLAAVLVRDLRILVEPGAGANVRHQFAWKFAFAGVPDAQRKTQIDNLLAEEKAESVRDKLMAEAMADEQRTIDTKAFNKWMDGGSDDDVTPQGAWNAALAWVRGGGK
jgi:hypothetical protein